MESVTTKFTKHAMTDAEFTAQIIPLFKEANVPFGYITNLKSWAHATNVVTIYEREFVEGNTYICVKDQVYKFNEGITVAKDFRKLGITSGRLMVKLEPDNFTVISNFTDLPQSLKHKLGDRQVQMMEAVEQQRVLDTVLPGPDELRELDNGVYEPFLKDTPTLGNKVPYVAKFASFDELKESTVFHPKPLSTEGVDLSTGEGFNRFLENRFERVRDTMGVKGDEYRKGGDVFHNFNRAAQMNHQIPEQALWGFASKQIISTIDLIDDIANGKLPSSTLVSEKCSDLVNYVLLLEAMVLKRIADSTGKTLQQ